VKILLVAAAVKPVQFISNVFSCVAIFAELHNFDIKAYAVREFKIVSLDIVKDTNI